MPEKSGSEKIHGMSLVKKLPKNTFKHFCFGKSQLIALIIILCILAGSAFLLIKTLTLSHSLWPDNFKPEDITSTDNSSIELGVKFESKYSGYITAIRFYKNPQNTGIHIGSLWSSSGALLARVAFTHESSSGWQIAALTQPVNIAANVMYMVSYHAPKGHYALTNSYFSDHLSYRRGPLTALANNGEYGANGVYINCTTPEFPVNPMNGTNFWLDIVFSTKLVTPPSAPAPPTIVSANQNGDSVTIAWNTGISANPIIGYNILRNGFYYAKVNNKTFTYTDKSVAPGLTYSYQIQTVDNSGKVSSASFLATITYNTVPPPTVSLSASSVSVNIGNSTTLSWYSNDAVACQATSPALWTLSTATSGSQIINPKSTATYQLICRNSWGSISSTPITIKVPPTVTLSASSTSIAAGNPVTLSWSSTNADDCQAVSPTLWTPSKAVSGSKSVYPTITTTYTLECIGSGENIISPPVTIKVTPVTSNLPQPYGNVSGPWKLIFDSEFNGSALNTSQWLTGKDGAAGITEGYDYTIEQECYDPAQVNVSDGILSLIAIAKLESCPPISSSLPYASGSVTTYGLFNYTYGYAEARIWLPGTTKITDWPAFWELGRLYDVAKGEIDIVEGLQGEACATFHNATSGPSYCSTGTFTAGWHTFAADWEPGYINFYYDGSEVLKVSSGVTASPMYLVLDLALSTNITTPDTTPATMQVDYVRVWQH